jgi:large subunit ribosomal protein L19
MASVIDKIQAKHMKKAVVDVKSGDTVRVHQKIREGGKERVQVFEGLVIRASRKNSLTSGFTVRRVASGVGVEKSFMIHSPNILKIEVVRRSRVRRNYLTYMRQRTGKSARLSGVEFDKQAVNDIHDEAAEAEEERIHEEQVGAYDPAAAKA